MAPSAALDVTQLEPFGVEVRGVDLAAPLDDVVTAQLRALYQEHLLVVFPGQSLDRDQQVAAAGIFGPVTDELENGTYASLVSNSDPEAFVSGNDALAFHADQSYTPYPVWGTTLYGVRIAGRVSPTRFVSLERALLALPDDLRERVDGLTAVDMADYSGNVAELHTPLRKRLPADLPPNTYPRTAHGVVIEHPRNHRRQLYVGEYLTVWIEGMPKTESDALLEELFGYIYAPDNVTEHHWKEGDLVLWDQFGLQHGRGDSEPGCVRELRRVAISDHTFNESLGATDHFLQNVK